MSTALEASVADALRRTIADGVAPGVVCAIEHHDATTVVAAGYLASHDGFGQSIVDAGREPVTAKTRYDLASVTKVYTALTILCLVDDDTLTLEDSVGRWLPEYRDGPKSRVTLENLLTHTSGLPPVWLGWHDCVENEGTADASWVPRDRDRILATIRALPLTRAPNETVEYSCVGYITAMSLAEAATGEEWEALVTRLVLEPLGLSETTFRPGRAGTAPTEYEPQLGRGMVTGDVHDETAFALGGVSGNAGLFATASDLMSLGVAMRDGFDGFLTGPTAARLWRDALPGILADRAAEVERELGFGHGLGLRIGASSWMGESFPDARGHNGFTGTSLLVDREHDLVVAILANRVHPDRVHPDRDHSDGEELRTAVHEAVFRVVSQPLGG